MNHDINHADPDCIFCKIAAGSIPSDVIYQDETCMAFLDINPVSHGHSLLIPRGHYAWMHETPDDVLAHMNILAKKLMRRMIANLPCDYVKIGIVGTDVAHFHMHLIPQKFNQTNPDPDFRTTEPYKDDEEKQGIINKLKTTAE